jgi:hypothetical protein
MRRLILGVAMLSAVTATPTLAQSPEAALRPGQRVRVTSTLEATPVMTGLIGEVGSDTLLLLRQVKSGDPRLTPIPMASIVELQVSRGTHSRWQTGLAIGAAAGAVTGVILGASSEGDLFFSTSDRALLGAIVFTPIGGAVGLIAGAVTKSERWETVPVPHPAPRPMVALQPGPGGRIRLRVQVPFRL